MISLCQSNLSTLAERLDVPTYDRARLTPSIVHIGVGGFHRAHQAVYLDELARLGRRDWGEVGVSLRTPSLRQALRPQDGLFTVVEQGPDTERARVVGVMTDYLYGPSDPAAVVQRLAHPDTRVVTLTVTGDGYGSAEPAHAPESDGPPATWADYLVRALNLRRTSGLGGVTVLSCDNLAAAGTAARTSVLRAAEAVDGGLASWVAQHVTFPDAMVDRITPGSPDGLSRRLVSRFGIHDRAPVVAEPFRQWVIEDDFCQGRPPLEDVGVQLVGDVAPYKLVKTRLLNGTHTAIAYLGRLAGHENTAELMRDPLMRAFTTELMRREVAPALPSVPGLPKREYVDTVIERLSNPRMSDPLDRLARRGSTKVPAYLLPSLVSAGRSGQPAPLLSLALAAWFRYLRGTDLNGRPIEVSDARLGQLQPLARQVRRDPRPLLAVRDLFGDLGQDHGACAHLGTALRDLDHGVSAAVLRALARSASGTPVPLLPAPQPAHRRLESAS